MTRLASISLLVLAVPAYAGEGPLGFAPAARDGERKAEKVLLDTPTPDRARRFLAALTAEPHVAGTPQEKKEAEYVRDRLKEFGFDVETVQYDVFLNHPKSVSLKLVEPVEMSLSLREEPEDKDKDSGRRGMFPAFHGYGASGHAEGAVVYVNYGSRADFEKLKGLGVSVEGRIVLARYGEVFRGLKVREAEERGAKGVLIYSDPADDGYAKGDVYPDGPMRPPSAIQRGSVQFLSLGPGDPSTPGYASKPGVKHLSRDKMEGIPKIPSLPIGYGEAEKILRRLGGQRVPDDWQGALPFAYHVGPGLAVASMDVDMDEGIRPIYDVIARIPGSTEPESLVILGNHRDAWTPGAVDPNSGTATLLETGRSLQAAVKAGWKPRRTVVLASWDAEEYGLVGSTEWVEDHSDILSAKAVAYLNCDVAVTGSDLRVNGVPSLLPLVREVAHEVPEPEKGGTIGDSWERRERSDWAKSGPVELGAPPVEFEPRLSPLGSGSDYTAFIDHLGIASLDFSFSGPYGVYHSVYDNFFWMTHFGDPAFVYHQAAARFYGLLAMRLSASDVVPLRFAPYAPALRSELDSLRRDAIRKGRAPLEAGQKPALAPDFAPILAALDQLGAAGRELDEGVDSALAGGRVQKGLSEALAQVERAFLAPEGLSGRPWFRHTLVAPGLTTGYAPWPFPGIRQAVEDRDPALFETESKKILKALQDGTARLKAAAALTRP